MTTLFDTLKADAADEWAAFTGHPFVSRLGDGTLPEECFRHYLGQDYLFLVHFARAYGLAVFKSDSLEDMRQAAAGMAAVLDEMGLHVKYCHQWGLTADEMAGLPEEPATLAYTRFVLERGLAGDLLDLHVALAPCVIGYAEIGLALAAQSEGNPYGEWIETYAAPEYQQVAQAQKQQLDRLMAARGGPGRMDALAATFRQAVRLETAFWDMGLRLSC